MQDATRAPVRARWPCPHRSLRARRWAAAWRCSGPRSWRRSRAIIVGGFLYETLAIGADAGGVAGGLVPGLAGTDSMLLA